MRVLRQGLTSGLCGLVGIWAAVGCGDAEVATPPNGFNDGGSSGAGNSGGTLNGGTGGLIDTDGGGAGGTAGDSGVDPCVGVDCGADQHCEADGDMSSCVANTCEELMCSGNTVCIETTDGAHCEEKCTDHVQCLPAEYCEFSTGKCELDNCTPGEARCQGNDLIECTPIGDEEVTKFSCNSPNPYYTSACTDDGAGQAKCPCEDDWDCPANTVCEVDGCTGTGVAPTCTLPPVAFNSVPPVNEIQWGGAGIGNTSATGSPFETSAQVVLTPLVANLDDDNADGKIDERDFPEIIFMTFPNSTYTTNGTLRAIHGGGVNKGKDYFANCGNTTWFEGDAIGVACGSETMLDPTSVPAVGDLDYDGVPEIVALTQNDGIRIFDNEGRTLSTSANQSFGGANPGVTIANLDNEGFAELIIGRDVYTLEHDGSGVLQVLDHFEGGGDVGKNGQGPVSCVANIAGDSFQEIVAGTTAYRFPKKPAGATKRADCTGSETDPDEVAWCGGTLPTLWDAPGSEGFCAIADVWGASGLDTEPPSPAFPLDGKPEVVLIRSGNVDVIDGETGNRIVSQSFNSGGSGGPPNIDDFDGDGFPEVGTAGSTAYVVTDFQKPTAACPAWNSTTSPSTGEARTPPSTSCMQDSDCGDTAQFGCNITTNQCVCLHNGWRRATKDSSSQVTGSSVFDFNGDGAAEVVYNDECFFRVYDGLAGTELAKFASESRTRIEYPIVADADNDGNAEIIFGTSNESGFCNNADRMASEYNNGIEMWGDANDLWVSARRIWNQHAYHVTNVTEGGSIPRFEPESWKPYNGRLYNTYRSNPRSFGVAPNLVVQAIQITSPGATCGQLNDEIEITVQISNIGDLRVGPGVTVAFYGDWGGGTTPALSDGSGQPLTATITSSLEPGDVIFLTVSYNAANDTPGVLPNDVLVRVDDLDVERECHEDDNELTQPVNAGSALADLRIQLDVPAKDCPSVDVPTTVFNDGSLDASNVVVRYYAGDPSAGGTVIHEVTRPGPIAAGGSDSFTATIPNFPRNASILIYGVVDPDNAIQECNDGNNRDDADERVRCGSIN
ncbi:MAG: CARDB domain-containing protein [Polyangiaceae bacterium]